MAKKKTNPIKETLTQVKCPLCKEPLQQNWSNIQEDFFEDAPIEFEIRGCCPNAKCGVNEIKITMDVTRGKSNG